MTDQDILDNAPLVHNAIIDVLQHKDFNKIYYVVRTSRGRYILEDGIKKPYKGPFGTDWVTRSLSDIKCNAKLTVELVELKLRVDNLLSMQKLHECKCISEEALARRALEMKAQGCFEAISEIKGQYVQNRLLLSAVDINNFAVSLTKQAEGLRQK